MENKWKLYKYLLANMSFETTLTYNEPLIRHAVFSYWRRSSGILFVPVLIAMTIWCVVLIVQGDASWQTGAFGTVIGFGFLISGSVYVVQYKNALAKLQDMGSPHAKFRAEEATFTFESGIGASTLQWSTVKEIWKCKNVWLMLFSKAHFSTLPLADISPEMLAFIEERVLAAGGKIG
jgi:hypothetical protein